MDKALPTAVNLAAAIICFGLGALVLYQKPFKRSHQAFAALTVVLTLWAIGVAVIINAPNESAAELSIRITFAVAAFVPIAFHGFIGVFSRPRFEGNRWWLATLLVATPVVIAGAFTDWYLVDVQLLTDEPPQAQYGVVFLMYAAMIGGTMLFSYPTLFGRLRTATEIERHQIEHIILGIAVFTTFTAITNIVLPLFNVGSLEAYGPAFLIALVSFFAYAMVRYHLMDVRVIISRTMVYAVGTVFVAATFFSAIAMVHFVFRLGGRTRTVLPTILAALVIAVVLDPLKERVRLILDRTILKRRYDVNQLLRRASTNASSIVRLDELLETICKDIRETVGVSVIRVMLVDENDPAALVIEYSSNPGEIRSKTWEHATLLAYLRSNTEPLLLKQLIHQHNTDERTAIAKHLAELEAYLCLPLVGQSQLVGILTLGEKISKQIFTSEEVVVFTALASPLVTAIQNARLYRQLEQANLHRERILSTMRGGLIATGADGRVTEVNQAALDMLGSVEAGQSLDALTPQVAQMLRKTLRDNQAIFDIETIIVRGDGERIPVALSSAPLPSTSERKLSGAVVMLYDLTQVKRLEHNMQRAHRLSSIGTLAAGMAHEIKNPLVSIKTFSQLLTKRYNDPDFRKTFMEIVPNEVERIDSIVSQLLDFARPKPARFAQHDLKDILNKILMLVENQTRKHNIHVITEFPDRAVEVYGDDHQMHQVFLNLVLNGIDSMRDNGDGCMRIRLSYGTMRPSRNGQTSVLELPCVRVLVSDSGCGIPPEELEGIFTPFFTTKEFGTGLGLSVVHGIVTEHGGQIDVDSTPGEGTTFTVSLPVSTALAAVEDE